MPGSIRYPEHLVFGLDIGTRSIVGTVGYKEGKVFKVVAQVSRFHETRSMLDGQIHDINKVAETISEVRQELERKIGRPLHDVCIAAAGRVLKTVTVRTDYEFEEDTVIEEEHIHSLNLLAVEKAYETIRSDVKENLKFYCVGYTVIRYYLNDYAIMNLLGHKANKAGTELIATFLPEEVIDGLYAAVQKAGLFVANLTLEPIAAINVAIPENYRLLNIGLVDVGAGTSDISITKDGSIVAYGMMPFAGDEITEKIAKNYLVDFKTAEEIKMTCLNSDTVTYKDIMGLSFTIDTKEVLDVVADTVQMITKNVASKIIELNGDKPVSAVFVVGGGGKLPGFTKYLAEYLDLPKERVALRGEEVMGDVEFLEESVKKDSTLVTPVGICLNFYEQKNNFIFVQLNGQRVKLYDNSKMTIADVAIQVGFPNKELFPQRGHALTYYLDDERRMVRGEPGEAAVVRLNGKQTGISAAIEPNDQIEIVSSTTGANAKLEVRELPEYKSVISFVFNGKQIECPKFVQANGELVSEYYEIKEGDRLKILNYYTLEQILQFMDLDTKIPVTVNNEPAELSDKVYENFTIRYEMPKYNVLTAVSVQESSEEDVEEKDTEKRENSNGITILINGSPLVMTGKENYIFVNVLDFYPFDTSTAKSSKLVTKVNDEIADFTTSLHDGDRVELYWEE